MQQSILSEGHVFEEEIEPPAANTQEGSDDDRSDIRNDDSFLVSVLSSGVSDGHGNCRRGGFHACNDTTQKLRIYNKVKCNEQFVIICGNEIVA